MTQSPVCCLPTDSVSEAAGLMKNENIGAIPVVENRLNNKLVGIITDRDLALKILADGLDATTTKVEAVMTRKMVTCRAKDDWQSAQDLMSKHQLRRIPVVDKNNALIGIIAQADMATRVDRPKRTAEMVRDISQVARH